MPSERNTPPEVPLRRELRKPYFLFRTPDGLGDYLKREVYRALFPQTEPFSRFLVAARMTGPQVKPPAIEYDLDRRDPSKMIPLDYLSKAEIRAFEEAARTFVEGAENNRSRITPYESELRTRFRLPDPDREPDAYWLHGPADDRKLLIFWGCEFEPGSSLPLLPTKTSPKGQSIVEKLRNRRMPWEGRQAHALEIMQQKAERLAGFVGRPIRNASNELQAILLSGKRIEADRVSHPMYFPASEVRRLEGAARSFYAKAHPDCEETSDLEKELRADLRFPDPSQRPEAYVMVKTDKGRQLVVLIAGDETHEMTLPVVEDPELSTPRSESRNTESNAIEGSVVSHLKLRTTPRKRFALIGAGAALILLIVVLSTGLLRDGTPPEVGAVSAENTPTLIRVTFTEGMDPASFFSIEELAVASGDLPSSIAPPRNFTLRDSEGRRLDIEKIEPDPADSRIALLHVPPLSDRMDYNLQIRGVRDTAGNALEEEALIRVVFEDTLPPELTGSPSADGSDPNTLILMFNEPLDERFSLIPANFQIQGFIVTEAKLDPVEPSVLSIRTNNPFANGERYTISISGVSDRAYRPNSIRDPITVEFPYVDQVSPRIREIRADGTQIEVHVKFNEPIQRGPAETPGNFVFSSEGADFTAESAVLLDDQQTVALRVPALSNGIEYTLTAIGIADKAAPPNLIADQSGVRFAYTGKPDLEAPLISALSPRGDGLRITVAFNEPLDPTRAIIASNYSLDDPTIGVNEVRLKDASTVFVSLDQPLTEAGKYRLNVRNIADVVGNVQASLTSREFRGPGLVISQIDVLGVAAIRSSPDGTRIHLTFTDEVTSESSTLTENYSLGDAFSITGIALSPDDMSTVILSVEPALGSNQYSLTIRDLALRSDPSKVQARMVTPVTGPNFRRQ